WIFGIDADCSAHRLHVDKLRFRRSRHHNRVDRWVVITFRQYIDIDNDRPAKTLMYRNEILPRFAENFSRFVRYKTTSIVSENECYRLIICREGFTLKQLIK